MKIAILSHFSSFQDSYALHVGWLERAKLLEKFEVDFDFLVERTVKDRIYPRQQAILRKPNFKEFEDKVKFYTDEYLRILTEYDVILTADLVYQTKGDFLPQNAAMREASTGLKVWWCHWIHSGWTNPSKVAYPNSLRHIMPPRSFLVYMNAELDGIAYMYNTDISNCFTVYNPKDYRTFNHFDDISNRIIEILDIPNKQAVQIFPFCSTRMDSKGIDGVIQGASALKRAGINTALILANANGRKLKDTIARKKQFMRKLGLVENEDFIWTSDLLDYKPLPRKAVSDLFKVSNYFVFTSWREACPNVLLEARISGCKLVLNQNVPSIVELGGPNVIYVDTTHKTPGLKDTDTGSTLHRNLNSNTYWDGVATSLIPQLPSLEHKWMFSFEKVWYNQFKSLLETAYQKSKEV